MNKRLLLAVFLLGLVLVWPLNALCQDLYVAEVSVAPTEGQAGDTITITARIGNHGPGMAFVVQLQWFLSEDSQMTTEDMALTEIETLPDYLYAGSEITIYRQVTLPPFQDAAPPSYVGLVIDPMGLTGDDNPANNSGSAAFTYSGAIPGFFDSTGDNYLDVTHVSAQVAGAGLEVVLTFSEPPGSTVSGIMVIDLDQDPATRLDATSPLGAEAIVSFLYQEYAPQLSVITAAGTTSLSGLTLDGNRLSYSIPLALLGNDGAMDLYWAVDHAVGPTTDFDRAPDTGVFATDSGLVVVRRPGDAAIRVDIADPVTGPAEPVFPNVKRLEARVVDDQLVITLTYNHAVENLGAYPGSDGLFVWIDFDMDQRLCTGFKSTEAHPPAFGIDYELRLQIDPLAGIVCELLFDGDHDGTPETMVMGLPFNDLFMRLADDKVVCRIPLGYLGFSDGGGALTVSNLNTGNILGGIMDRVPDSGAWDLKADAALAGQNCRGAVLHVDDPDNDSIGAFGLDNDEQVGIDVCVGERAFLFSLDYKSYLLSNDGATLIYLDTDRNPATGWEITNIAGDTRLGADHILRTHWDYDNLFQVTKVIHCRPPEQVEVKNQLTAVTLANRLYITIPFECLANPAGPVDLLIGTASWGAGQILLANDNIPDSGLITLSMAVLWSDLDHDGDVDGRDLAMLISNPALLGLGRFAADFGRAAGP